MPLITIFVGSNVVSPNVLVLDNYAVIHIPEAERKTINTIAWFAMGFEA